MNRKVSKLLVMAFTLMLVVALMVPSAALAVPVPTNLIVNGGFESGGSGFATVYRLRGPAPGPKVMYDPLTYVIGSNPGAYHDLWASYAPHSGANMMIVNGYSGSPEERALTGLPADADTTVWSETVSIPSTADTYHFSMFMANSYGDSPAPLGVYINGELKATLIAPTAVLGTWSDIGLDWTNTTGVVSAEIAIKCAQSVYTGNDFAIDDISFFQIPKAEVDFTKIWAGEQIVGTTFRPESITVNLLCDGEPVLPDSGGSMTVHGDDDWAGSFTGLPAGHIVNSVYVPYTYSLSESVVPNYNSAISQDGNRFVITNTFKGVNRLSWNNGTIKPEATGENGIGLNQFFIGDTVFKNNEYTTGTAFGTGAYNPKAGDHAYTILYRNPLDPSASAAGTQKTYIVAAAIKDGAGTWLIYQVKIVVTNPGGGPSGKNVESYEYELLGERTVVGDDWQATWDLWGVQPNFEK